MKNPFKKLTKNGAAMPQRTSQEIQQDYVNACAQYGAKQYQVNVHKEEMAELYRKIKALNHEAFALQQSKPVGSGSQVPQNEPAKDPAPVVQS